MYKIIACDLDETLLNSKREVSKKNAQAVRKATEAGVHFVPATGRGFKSVRKTLEKLGLYKAHNEFVISFNGGAVTENSTENFLHFEGLDFNLAKELFECGKAYDVCMHAYTKDTVYVYNFVESEKKYLLGRMEVQELKNPDISFLENQDIVKILFMNEDESYRKKIENDLASFSEKIDITFSSGRYIEFNKKGVNKGKGLSILAQKLGVPIGNTIAIGDNFNDLPMIKAAGLGIGVSNCAAGIKKDCDYITQADCDNDAICEVIDKFIFGKTSA